MIWPGVAGKLWRGSVGLGVFRFGLAGTARRVMSRRVPDGTVWHGMAGEAGLGSYGLGWFWQAKLKEVLNSGL